MHRVGLDVLGPSLLRFGTDEQRRLWSEALITGERSMAFGLTEPQHGSDATWLETNAQRDGSGSGGWVINGSKTYIANGQIADLIIVAARTVPDKTHGLGLFLVEADMPGFKRGRNRPCEPGIGG